MSLMARNPILQVKDAAIYTLLTINYQRVIIELTISKTREKVFLLTMKGTPIKIIVLRSKLDQLTGIHYVIRVNA